jgi:hypothetical protein
MRMDIRDKPVMARMPLLGDDEEGITADRAMVF